MKSGPGRILLLSLVVLVVGVLPALAANLLSKGIAYYQRGDYLRARRYFQMVLRRSPNYWPAHYELANTYVKMNQPALAKGEYMATLNARPDAKTAKISGQMVTFLNTRLSKEAHQPDAAGGTASAVNQPTSGGKEEFKHRIYVVKPRFDHPPVRQSTINLVTDVVDRLPPNVYEALDRGGATVNLSPNMTDKWPDTMKNMDAKGLHMAQDAARCYEQNVYIYDRPLVKGTKNLGNGFAADGIKNVLYHELGHATDWSMGKFSASQEVITVHTDDVNSMSPAVKSRLWYYTTIGPKGSVEAVAETFAGLMGAQGKDTALVAQHFPRLRAWLKNKLKL